MRTHSLINKATVTPCQEEKEGRGGEKNTVLLPESRAEEGPGEKKHQVMEKKQHEKCKQLQMELNVCMLKYQELLSFSLGSSRPQPVFSWP